MMHRFRTLALAAGTVAAAGALLVSPASAAPLEGGSYEFVDEYTYRDCGMRIHEVDTFTGSYVIKDSTPSTGGEYFRILDRQRHTFALTNLRNGESIRIELAILFSEGPGTVISDDGRIVRYRTNETGSVTVYSDEGDRLLAEHGTITIEWTFDSQGDGAPGGEFLSSELVRVAGPHPWFDGSLGCDEFTTWFS